MATKKDAMKFGTSSRIVSPEGRLSYPALLKPTAFQAGDDPKYKTSLILKKGDDEVEDFIEKLQNLQQAAMDEAWGKGKRPKNLEEWGIIDGDETDDDMYEDSWVIRAANKAKPALVDADRNEIIDESEVYGGANARINVVGFAYGGKAKGGVTVQLLAVQMLGGGEPFGGAAKAIQEAAMDF